MNTSTKEVKKVAITEQEFNNMVNLEKRNLAINYMKAKNKDLNSLDKFEKQFENEAINRIGSVYRVKGTRSGHINSAPLEIQKLYSEAMTLVEQITFTKDDGESYKATILVKKVVVEG